MPLPCWHWRGPEGIAHYNFAQMGLHGGRWSFLRARPQHDFRGCTLACPAIVQIDLILRDASLTPSATGDSACRAAFLLPGWVAGIGIQRRWHTTRQFALRVPPES
jgi:hypothetical protein